MPLPNKFPTRPTTTFVTLLIFAFPSLFNVSNNGILLPLADDAAAATDDGPAPLTSPSSPSKALYVN